MGRAGGACSWSQVGGRIVIAVVLVPILWWRSVDEAVGVGEEMVKGWWRIGVEARVSGRGARLLLTAV